VPEGPPPVAVPEGPFGVVSLHRFELINNRSLFGETLRRLRESPVPLVFIDHPVTVAAMRRHGLDAPGRVPRLGFSGWVRLLRAAAFVVSDSGGAQEECFVLDRPCLVHRRRTERRDGLGETSVVSRFDPAVVSRFLAGYEELRRLAPLPEGSPTQRIVDDLVLRQVI
jgi:UDP-N-acetylglucosamine 2-epimerase (non-hydrolysing)